MTGDFQISGKVSCRPDDGIEGAVSWELLLLRFFFFLKVSSSVESASSPAEF